MEKDGALRNNVKALRSRLRLSQQYVADSAHVTRQTIGAIEAGLYAPSATVALRIARALYSSVEDVFWFDDESSVAAEWASGDVPQPARVILARFGDRWVAHALCGAPDQATCEFPADGLAGTLDSGRATVSLLDDIATLSRGVLAAGCAPALGLWARTAERSQPGTRVPVLTTNSTRSLEMLAHGQVHLASVHYSAPENENIGQSAASDDAANWSAVSKALTGRGGGMVNFGAWREGLLVAAGNPKGIRDGSDLARGDVTLVNREKGASSRAMLDEILREASISASMVHGYGTELTSPAAVAHAVACGAADVAVGVESAARLYGIGCVPLRTVQYDLVYLDEYATDPMRRLLDSLAARRVRAQLTALGGCDTSRTGETRAIS